jgi:hypothetical protein
MKRVNNSIYLSFLYGILYLFLLFNQSCNYVEKRHDKRKISTIQGVVVQKYRDKWNHGSPMLKLNTGSIIGVGSWAKNSYLWEHIEIGDSISKLSGTTDLTLFKKNGEYFLYTFNE